MPHVIKNDITVWFDVDDTLVVYNYPPDKIDETILVAVDNVEHAYQLRLWPHKQHIERLKQFKARGQAVFVWSQGGHEWAAAVIKALNLEEYVDVICCKPMWIFDDLPASAWLGARSYIDPITGESMRKERHDRST